MRPAQNSLRLVIVDARGVHYEVCAVSESDVAEAAGDASRAVLCDLIADALAEIRRGPPIPERWRPSKARWNSLRIIGLDPVKTVVRFVADMQRADERAPGGWGARFNTWLRQHRQEASK